MQGLKLYPVLFKKILLNMRIRFKPFLNATLIFDVSSLNLWGVYVGVYNDLPFAPAEPAYVRRGW